MLIRLVPAYPHPNIVFTITLPDPMHDDNKPCPAAWLVQVQTVQALLEEGFELDPPKDIHALDKAAWHTALITEVVFDLTERTIVCNFVDESSVAWPLLPTGSDAGCIAALEEVVADVRSAAEIEKQRSRNAELRQLQTSSYQAGTWSQPVSPVSPMPAKAHRRQRSLFSSIVAAVKGALSDSSNRTTPLPLSLPPLKIPSTPSHSRSPSTFSRTQRSPPLSPVTVEPPPLPVYQLNVRPRVAIPLPSHCKPKPAYERLRHKARSSLMDIFRRYVLPVFSTTSSPSFVEVQYAPDWRAQVYGYPPGQYPGWIGRSVLRKTEERMREMIAEASAHGFGLGRPQVASPVREVEDEDDATSASTSPSVSTETDGSSIHTPMDPPAYSPFAPVIVSAQGNTPRLSLHTKTLPHVPRSPSPPSPASDFDLSAYHALATARSRLLAILARLDSSPRQVPCGTPYSADLTILEIKSRRRAWSARDYVGGAQMTLLGLATPFCSSSLARCEPVTAETLAHVQAQPTRGQERLGPGANRSVGLSDVGAEFGVRVVTKEMDARLFPVCEEDEEPDYTPSSEMGEYMGDEAWRDMQEFDLESGLLAFPRPEHAPASESSSALYAHMHPMVRTRTRSMREEESPRLSQRLAQQSACALAESVLSTSSMLQCQSLNVKVPVPVVLDCAQPFAYDDDERDGEFTLAMDLPPPPRGWLGDDVDGVRCR